jgi:hypothetical protein
MVSLYPLIKKQNSVSFHSKLILFKAYLLPNMIYACPVWANLAACHLKKIQTLQNKILRMVLSAKYSTKITKLHNKAKIAPIQEVIKKITDKFYGRVGFVNNKLISNLGKYTKETILFKMKHKLPKKI